MGNNLEADFTHHDELICYKKKKKKARLLLPGPDHLFCESWISRAENWVDEFQ